MHLRTDSLTYDYDYYHSDHLGSASYITDLDGQIVQHIEYIPFGAIFLEERNNHWNTPYLFNSKELHDEIRRSGFVNTYKKQLKNSEQTGFYYYGARYYDPRVSQWLSVDPLAEKTLDPYGYCYQNPVKLIDPDGKYPIYGAEGEYLGDDGRSGDGDLAFTGSVTKRDTDGKAVEFGNLSQFTDNHKGFLQASGKIYSESSGDKTENLWIAHAVNNASKNIDISIGDNVIDQINGKGYSTTKGNISLKDNSSNACNARAGLIDVLSGGADPTGGVTHWDGMDYLKKGITHNKFNEYSRVDMSEIHFKQFQSAQQKKYKTVTSADFDKSCTPDVTNGSWGWNGANFYHVASENHSYRLKSAAVRGATIFWKTIKN